MTRQIFMNQRSQSVAFDTTNFWVIDGSQGASGTEADRQCTLPIGAVWSLLLVDVTANDLDATMTYRTRINAADGNQLISVLTTATGIFQDTTNQDVLATDDQITYESDTNPPTMGDITTLCLSSVMTS